MLFGALPARFREKSRWLLALDRGGRVNDLGGRGLFDVPFATLVEGGGSERRFLIERHAIQIVPGAAASGPGRRAGQPRLASGLFLGVGDPFTTLRTHASPPARLGRAEGFFDLFAATRAGDSQLLLPAWYRARRKCAPAPGPGRPGGSAGGGAGFQERLLAELGRGPAAIHFATHVLESAGSPSHGLVALSLLANGEPEVLTARDTAHWKLRGGIVVSADAHRLPRAVLPGPASSA